MAWLLTWFYPIKQLCFMKYFTLLLSLVFSYPLITSFSGKNDFLEACLKKQVPAEGSVLRFAYAEDQHAFYHSEEPWLTMDVKSSGEISCTREQFLQQDTARKKDRVRVSTLKLDTATLLIQPYWRKTPLNVDRATFDMQVLELARYSPVLLIHYFARVHATRHSVSNDRYAVYSHLIGKTHVELWIRKSDQLLEKVVTRHHDDMLGDVSQTLIYSDFQPEGKVIVPASIRVVKMRGVTDDIHLTQIRTIKTMMPVLEKPEAYKIDDDMDKIPEVQLVKMAEHIYRINLKHAETQSGLIEFKDFFVVIDAPLSSANGELIIQEAHKIAPGKPIRYFGFGHHHAWYMGGIRPFIHDGVTILSTSADLPYVKFIAEAPHALKPDSLYLDPKPLLSETVDSQKVISDGVMEVQVYHIGLKSGHTLDYMIFYIPSEKLVFVDDLVWIEKEGPLTKPSVTQAGFYNAVKELGLDVRTVVQCWPTGEQRSNKTVIDFREIEQSMQVKE
jgi:glyoxylase-like metal-dependent hydrolase (beta-lactamase superfamily II)